MKVKSIFASFLGIGLIAGSLYLGAPTQAFSPLSTKMQDEQPKAKKPDPRKQTTIQRSFVASGKARKAIEVLYLNLPFGETTFGYLEKGGNDYYSNRTWPFAHIKLAVKAQYEDKTLAPGNYVIYITPKSEENPVMSLTLASFKPKPKEITFLTPGDVFTDTPENTVEIKTKPIAFTKGAAAIDHLEIELQKESEDVNINIHYGDRTLTEKLKLN